MKLKTRPLTKLAVTALCAALMLSSASADVVGKTSTKTVDGVTYKYYAEVYVVSNGRYKAAATITRSDNQNIPSGTSVTAAALLYDTSGDVIRETEDREHDSGTSFAYVATSTTYSSRAVYGQGRYTVNDSKPFYSIYTSTVREGTRSVPSADAFVAQLASQTLTAGGQYPTNAAGETYGSGLLVNTVGEEPDLISAVGVSGVRGYIRSEDTFAPDGAAAQDNAQGRAIPLYDLSGNVIDSFVIEAPATDYSEEMQAHIQGLKMANAQAMANLQALEAVKQSYRGDTAAVTTAAVSQEQPLTEEETMAAIRTQYAHLVVEEYPVNSHGETYGSMVGKLDDEFPDLIACRATNGERGYYRHTEREAVRGQGAAIIPVYDCEGVEIVGYYQIDAGR